MIVVLWEERERETQKVRTCVCMCMHVNIYGYAFSVAATITDACAYKVFSFYLQPHQSFLSILWATTKAAELNEKENEICMPSTGAVIL